MRTREEVLYDHKAVFKRDTGSGFWNMVLGGFMTGCGNKGAGDVGDSSKQTATSGPSETAGNDTIKGLVGTPSDYSREDNWLAVPRLNKIPFISILPVMLMTRKLQRKFAILTMSR